MSYEGYTEYLCENGHYCTADTCDDDPDVCPICDSKLQYFHMVDLTNGEDDTNPNTMIASKTRIKSEDIWKQDHYGNRYAIIVYIYKPNEHWQRCFPDSLILVENVYVGIA